MQRCFMMLYKQFRIKKYGEYIENNDDEEDMIESYIPKTVLETDG